MLIVFTGFHFFPYKMQRKKLLANILKSVFEKIEDNLDLMAKRKNDHIQICKNEQVESVGHPFSQYHFIPEALPELNFEEVSSAQHFFQHTFSMPLLITGMTGGVEHGQEINQILAKAAEKFQIPMGLGSQKMLLKDPSLKRLFDVRGVAPNVFLIGNIGAVSFNYGVQVEQVVEFVHTFSLNAFALHLNALQECVQPEGERNFSNLLHKIEKLATKLPVPLMIKEVGSGMSASTFQKLVNAGAQIIDVGGNGGTSWSAIEGMRASKQGARLGELFRNWGYSTDKALVDCAQLKQKLNLTPSLVATGGIRDGLQVAKAVALGATLVGVGLPLFRAAVNPPAGCSALEAVEHELEFFKSSLLVSMFCSGAKTLNDLSCRIVHNARNGCEDFSKM